MKKLGYLLIAVFSGVLLVSSCSKSDSGTTGGSSGGTTGVAANPNAPTLKLTLDKSSASTGDHISITAVATGKKKAKVIRMTLNERANGVIRALTDLTSLLDSTKAISYDYVTGTPGTKYITLIATDNAGNEDSTSQTLTITGTSLAPSLKVTYNSTTLDAGALIKGTFKCTSPLTQLASVSIKASTNGAADIPLFDSTLSGLLINFTKQYSTSIFIDGTLKITTTVTDANNITSTDVQTITLSNAMVEYNNTIDLGTQLNSGYKHALNLSTGVMYDSASATSSNTDLVLVGDVNSDHIYLSSPSANSAGTAYPWLSAWSGKRTTNFNNSYYITKFSTLSDIIGVYNTSGSTIADGSVNMSNQVNKAFTFKTQDGKYGVILITNVYTGSSGGFDDGDAKITVFIQK